MCFYLEKFCSPLQFGNEDQIVRIKVINKILSSIPGGWERFDETFEPCGKLQQVLLNFRSLERLDRKYMDYMCDVTFGIDHDIDDEDWHYVQSLLKWRPSSCFKQNAPNNQLTLF